MPTVTEKNRPSKVQSPLGEDKLVLTGFSGSEQLSRLFTYEVDVTSAEDTISPGALIGKPLGFSTELANGETRYFHGIINGFSSGDRSEGDRKYRATMVPWLWFLTRTSDVRIFQQKSVPEIVEQIFQDLGFTDYDLSNVKGSHPTLDYCVQFRETDYNFVCRLLEQEGIFFFFRHEEERHVLVLADSKTAHKPLPESEVEYEKSYGSRTDHEATLTGWQHRYQFTTGAVARTDYNFETPKTSLMTQASTLVKLPNVSKFEHYDYPGLYPAKSDGEPLTRARMEETEAGFDKVTGESVCKSFAVGGKFTIKKHDVQSEEGKSYVITSIRHSFTTHAGENYRNSFTCIPDSVVFRPERITEKPCVYGPQTAVVTGPDGEEIYTDKYGRIKVQFHWDREGKKDEKTSCWIRCVQSSAGRGWGSMFIPRIGQEVVVTFLDGDPDRPLVTGVVYNADQMPAYELPAEKTKSYIKTNSSKGGEGYNEIRFEDLAGEEQIFMHAQKNFDLRVLNDRHEHVEGSMQLKIGHKKSGNPEEAGNLDIVIEKRKRELIGKDGFELHIEGDRKEQVDGKVSLKVGSDQQIKLGGSYALDAGSDVYLKAGANCVIEAGASLTLKVGGSFVNISSAGVAISGATVLINSGGAAGSGSPASPDVPKDAEAEADDSKSGKKSC